MINDIINGIATKLNETFGNKYQVWRENIKQGLTEPCFSIVALEPEQSAKLPTRYLRKYPFDIHYFPKDKLKEKEECYTVAEELYVALEYINVLDNLCHGTKMRYEVVDGVLHFFVNYDMFVKKQVAGADQMEQLEVKSTTEG